MQNKTATTADEYLSALPNGQRESIAKVRSVVRKHLPKGFSEFVSWGMLSYGVPLKRFPNTYNGQPLCYAALAAQKNHCSLYLMAAGDQQVEARLQDAFTAAGKKLDMGKSCVHFKSPDDLPLDVVGEIIASVSVEKWIEIYEKSRKRN